MRRSPVVIPKPEPPSPPPSPQRWVGRTVRFDHEGKRLTGIITAVVENGIRGPGAIPDFLLTIRGASGRSLTVSMFDTYADIEN